MADERRRYLAQQIELGGSEVFLERPADLVARNESMVPPEGKLVVRSPSEGPSAPAGEGEGNADAPRAGAADEPKWKRGAPPVPGPGLHIETPPASLLGNDLSSLTSIEEVAERIRTTACCELCVHRLHAVPGEGDPRAKLMLVGEGPGANEDATGRPFVGQAGKLLDGILEAIDVPRKTVYITNIVKCRPPQNRKPLPDEIAACLPYLHRQLELIRPKVILALGGTAGEALLGVRKSLGELRSKVHTFNGTPLVVTYHPAALLRNPNWKKPTWDDVRIVRQLLDR